ncbi:MAG: serpin family protein, partial [Candidatus Cloacimonetes bacterium]|nr:serpin family protein [Candidatus Cloacimonadota bacterium]
IYFKGDWEYEFDKELTKELPFWINKNKKVMVPMMYQKDRFKYSKHEDYQMLELAYTGKELSMFIFLPNEIDGLSKLEKKLKDILFTYSNQFAHQKMVEVYLPKFEFTQRFVLNKKLETLGMKDAFIISNADFSGITGNKKLFIHNIIHKAYVKVDEQGTEAAAATAVLMAESAEIEEPIFKADHPFIFLVRDNETGSILFIGRIVDPLDK